MTDIENRQAGCARHCEAVAYKTMLRQAENDLNKARERIKHLEAFLFPYANATDISGISWDGKYLIGDKASISAFHELKNRGEQIDVYKRAYDQHEEVYKQRIIELEAELVSYEFWYGDRGPDE